MTGNGGLWGSVVESGSAALQAIYGNKEMGKARESINTGYQQAADERNRQYAETQAYLKPYQDAAQPALTKLSEMGKSGYKFSSSDPSYQWRMEQGQKALERSAAARGNLMSGGHLKSLANYSQGLASTEYQNEYNRQMQLANLGAKTASQQAGYSSNLGGQASQAAIDRGEANAAVTMAKYLNWQEQDSRAAGTWSSFFRGGYGGLTDEEDEGDENA